ITAACLSVSPNSSRINGRCSRVGAVAIRRKDSTIRSLANTKRICYRPAMDEGRKRVIGIMAAILASLHMQTADDLFGTPQGSPRTDKLIAASIQWAEKIMEKIDNCCSTKQRTTAANGD